MRMQTLLLLTWLTGANASATDGWRYVVPLANDPMAHPPPRILALLSDKPADLKWEVSDLGQRQRYGHLLYGTGRLAPLAIALLEFSDGSVQLYVDADRNRTLTKGEGAAGTGREWRVAINAMVADGDKNIELPRTVLFRYSGVTRTLAVATCGYCEGETAIDGKTIPVRRVDGDCNGLLADAQDRVWLNYDGDDRWDAVTEQHLVMPILRIDRRRFALRADVLGQRLSLTPLVGFGTVGLALPKSIAAGIVEDIVVTVQDREGLLATVRQLDGSVETPVGDYRVCSVSLTLKDPDGGPSWGYVFNDRNEKTTRWQPLAHGGALSVDPIGALEFAVQIPDQAKAGDTITARPTLHTHDGLLIERAYRGPFSAFASGCHATTAILDAAGNEIASEASGFA